MVVGGIDLNRVTTAGYGPAFKREEKCKLCVLGVESIWEIKSL